MRELGHDVHVLHRYDGAAADMMVALHAWRSADSIRGVKHPLDIAAVTARIKGKGPATPPAQQRH